MSRGSPMAMVCHEKCQSNKEHKGLRAQAECEKHCEQVFENLIGSTAASMSTTAFVLDTDPRSGGPTPTAPPGFEPVYTTDSNGQVTLINVPASSPFPPVPAVTTLVTASSSPPPAVTVTNIVSMGTPSSTSAAASASTSDGLSFGAKMAAILVPILVFLALIPIAYLFYLSRRNRRRDEQDIPELRFPPETRQLVSNSRRNSESLPSPFADSPGTRSGSMGIIERPSSEILRMPSPTLPSPALPVFRMQEAWPLTAPLPEPPMSYRSANHSLRPLPEPPVPLPPPDSSLRPPSSSYGEPSPQLRSPPAFMDTDPSAHSVRTPLNNRDSDAISEMSFDPAASRRKSHRDADEMSLVSALAPDDHPQRHSHQAF